MRTWKARQVMDMLNIRKSRIQYYVDQGLIVPIVDSDGPGTHRLFSTANILEIKVVMVLACWIGIKDIRTIMSGLSGSFDKVLKDDCDVCFLSITIANGKINNFGIYSVSIVSDADVQIAFNISALARNLIDMSGKELYRGNET